MKIDSRWRTLGKRISSRELPSSHIGHTPSFADLYKQQEEKKTHQELSRMLDEIHKQGERLTKSMTVRELMAFKSMVKSFLEETVRRGVGLKETRGFDRRGRTKRYKIIEEVDRQLLSLADELLESEEGRLTLLNKIGEIRGLLINLLY